MPHCRQQECVLAMAGWGTVFASPSGHLWQGQTPAAYIQQDLLWTCSALQQVARDVPSSLAARCRLTSHMMRAALPNTSLTAQNGLQEGHLHAACRRSALRACAPPEFTGWQNAVLTTIRNSRKAVWQCRGHFKLAKSISSTHLPCGPLFSCTKATMTALSHQRKELRSYTCQNGSHLSGMPTQPAGR